MVSGRALHITFLLSLLVALLLQMVQMPDFLAGARPLWLPLMLAYWSLTEPRVPTLAGALVSGLVCDVLFGSVLGQHALGLILVVYLVTRLRPIFALFPLWQATLALSPVWLLFAFTLFWIDGATRHQANLWLRWLPVISTTLFWPLIYIVMESLLGRRNNEE